MGMDQSVTFGNAIPAWNTVQELLAAHGYPVEMRMIDGQLAFPDEEPPQTWSELRFNLPGGMVTVRRDGQRLVFVTWGNADDTLRQAWNALTWAFAAAGGGRIVTEVGEMSLVEFQARAELPPTIQSLF
jgi:hypothetical protein